MRELYECALSGIQAEASVPFTGDELNDLPVGWTEVRVSRRVFNPKWVLIQQVKDAMIQGLKAQFGEALKDPQQELVLQLQVEAQLYGLEQNTPMYITEVEVAHLAPPDTSAEILEAVNQFREMIGLEPLAPEEDGEGEDEGEDKK